MNDFPSVIMLNKLIYFAGEPFNLSEVAPYGDLAHGLAWSYYFGYINLIEKRRNFSCLSSLHTAYTLNIEH